MKMRIATLIGVLIASTVEAGGLIGDIDRAILEDVQEKIDQSGVSAVKESQLDKATNICQEKCAVCFDGVACNFDCVKEACLGSRQGGIDVR